MSKHNEHQQPVTAELSDADLETVAGGTGSAHPGTANSWLNAGKACGGGGGALESSHLPGAPDPGIIHPASVGGPTNSAHAGGSLNSALS